MSETSNSTNLFNLLWSSSRLISSIKTPLSMKPITSAMFSISLRIWLEIRIVTPYSQESFLSKPRISLIPNGSRPFIGSSRINNSGLCIIAAAIPKRCFIPNEKSLNCLFFSSPKLTISKTILTFRGL